ncbi:ankyrin repeat domain-containing protein [Sansalvadorimonas sp. 2012CJ34-2]|uniref:Ankyrin repeat domain-containing protein n=1 Tax=Parendozoicomonas callyspongiae TaxID=2942213 RepID=A0ABT0PFX5_9GAMM|nr:ankyrin repeat domain-containing protein [Sansalvadorimonas sp. 2012CJ34-2]MCL6270220.1 ankyrin repeat domain-containing protein [Sansalvadorimonas sp. 2012CJ34-2]
MPDHLHFRVPRFSQECRAWFSAWLFSVLIAAFLVSGLVQADGRKAVEDVLVQPWQASVKEFRQTGSQRALTIFINAPVSGFSEGSRQNLLTFSGTNNLPDLARWAVKHGADINTADGAGSTFLLSAVSNRNPEMLQLALDMGGQVNLQTGPNRDTLLGALMRWGWSTQFIWKALEAGAELQSEEERLDLLRYVARQDTRDQKYDALVRRIRTLGIIPRNQLRSVVSANAIDVNMQVRMDLALQDAISSGVFADEDFQSFGEGEVEFARFLAGNSFPNALRAFFNRYSAEHARNLILVRDKQGYDLVIHALKTGLPGVLEVVLSKATEGVNRAVPGGVHGGQWPMHLAVMWRVPDSSFDLLKRYGGRQSLEAQNHQKETPAGLLRMWRERGILDQKTFLRIEKNLTEN